MLVLPEFYSLNQRKSRVFIGNQVSHEVNFNISADTWKVFL